MSRARPRRFSPAARRPDGMPSRGRSIDSLVPASECWCSRRARRRARGPGERVGRAAARRPCGDDRSSRDAAPEAVAACQEAGVRVLMVTGDHPRTARAIGAALGLPDRDAVTGPQLDELDEDALRREAASAEVYARVAPEHKLRLVRALQAEDEVVAMTGDGVNDAPALRQADIGVAMGVAGRPRRRTPRTWCWPTTTSPRCVPRSRKGGGCTTTSSRRSASSCPPALGRP